MRIGALTLFICLGGSHTVLRAAEGPLDVAEGLRFRGAYAQSEAVLREALRTSTDSPYKAALLNDLADLLREQDRDSEARPYFEAALRVKDISWKVRCGAMLGLADLDREEHAWPESLSKWNEVVGIAETHANTMYEAYAIRGLGQTWLNRGDLSRAEPLLKRSLALLDNQPDVPGYRLLLTLDTLGTLYRLQGKTGLAEDTWSRELQVARQVFGDYHPQTALVMGHLAEVWSWNGDLERARDYSRQVTSIMENHFADDSPALASALASEALVEQRAHRLEDAAKLYARAFSMIQSVKPSGNLSQSIARMYANVLSELHRGREAKQIMAEASAFHAK